MGRKDTIVLCIRCHQAVHQEKAIWQRVTETVRQRETERQRPTETMRLADKERNKAGRQRSWRTHTEHKTGRDTGAHAELGRDRQTDLEWQTQREVKRDTHTHRARTMERRRRPRKRGHRKTDNRDKTGTCRVRYRDMQRGKGKRQTDGQTEGACRACYGTGLLSIWVQVAHWHWESRDPPQGGWSEALLCSQGP